MATVERAEQRTQSDETSSLESTLSSPALMLAESSAVEPAVEPLSVESLSVESLSVEAWFTSVAENADYDAKFIEVA
jgi:hypothetical protein